MKKTSKTIVFFGSGPVAARSLELLQQSFAIEAVITKPQPAHHKDIFPVIAVAQKYDLPIMTASNRRELDELILSSKLASRVAVLVDYGIIVSQSVIDHFPLGIVNSHFSLLPEWRGADPITFAILSGQRQTGVSLMLLVEKMDEGPLLAVGVHELTNDTNTPELTDKLIDLSFGLLKAELPRYMEGKAKLVTQEEIGRLLPNYPTKPSYSRKLTKDDGILNPTKPAEQLEREVRAFIEWPKSRTTIAGKDVIITHAHVAGYEIHPAKSHELFPTPDGLIGIPTSEGVLVIDRLKPAGKPEMSAQAFLAGNKLD